MKKEPPTRFCGVLIIFHEVTKFWIGLQWRHSKNVHNFSYLVFCCIFLLTLRRKNLLKRLMEGLWFMVSQSCKITKLWMIRQSLDTSDAIPPNEHHNIQLCLKCNLFKCLVMWFCFMLKKVNLSKSCYKNCYVIKSKLYKCYNCYQIFQCFFVSGSILTKKPSELRVSFFNLLMQMCIDNHVKHLRWNILRTSLTIFAKCYILFYVWQDYQCAYLISLINTSSWIIILFENAKNLKLLW